jgi:alpha-glucoside transport system substrate-binding protein
MRARSIGLVVLAAALAAGCGHSGGSTPPATEHAAAAASAATPASTDAATSAEAPTSAAAPARELEGQHVRVLGMWSGPEFDSFEAVKAAWEEETGGIVDWEWTRNLPGDLGDAVQAGEPPDVAILSSLAQMQALAADGTLVPLDSALDMTQVEQDYAPAWIDLGSYDGHLYGLFYKVTDKSTVWYSPKAFAAAGYEVPQTWDELTALADRIVADGRAPFSIVAASGPASGWALTDWISEIVLNACGPALYDQWIAAEVPWTDPCIRQSFERFAGLLRTKGYVLGGSERVLATGDAEGADPLYTEPPEAYMYYLASFAQAFIASTFPDLEPGADFAFFRFPSIDPSHGSAVTIGADIPVLVGDTPAARSFMTYLAGARAQEAWIERGGFTSVNRSVGLDAYRDPVARALAEDLTGAEAVRFSAGDVLPTSLQRAWWKAMLELVKRPGGVDAVLASLDAAADHAR